MPFDAMRLAKYRAGMRRRIEELKRKTEDSLDFAMDTMMQNQVDTYFHVEEGLVEIGRTLALIEEDLASIGDMTGANRLESRLEFMEDRFEELDSEVRQRPRRRRRRINFADFFRTATGGDGATSGARSEIGSAGEAFRVLGVAYGSSMTQVTAAFRQRAKQLHPDVRRGDRSSEPELRRILEAYQYLKEYLSLSRTEPPRNG